MIFVDTNVFMYAVGSPHRLKEQAREFFQECSQSNASLYTSAEVLQELLHAYLPVRRSQALDAAMALIEGAGVDVWPLEEADIALARQLYTQRPFLAARDLCHLASCRRRGVREIKTFDQTLADAALAMGMSQFA